MKSAPSDAFARYNPAAAAASHELRSEQLEAWLLTCGILSAALYPTADIIAALRYPGYSYTDQAVSELFAIGAPTSTLVVRLFTLSTALLLPFALGVWRSARSRRAVRLMSIMLVLHALDALTLWNFFPMHMRGQPMAFTDTMHGLLAIDPFLLVVMIAGAVAWPGRFRWYTIATIAFGTIMIASAIPHVSAVYANQPTPWMGLTERSAQYANNLWLAVLAIVAMRDSGHSAEKSRDREDEAG